MRPLSPKQRRFVDEYLIDLNASAAARRAGYSVKTAQAQSSRLLSNVIVAAAITAACAERSKRTKITQDMVLRELALIGFADMGTYLTLNPDGTAHIDWSRLPLGATKVISEIQQEVTPAADGRPEVRKTKFKLYNKRAALVDIGKHLGMFVDRFEDVSKPSREERLRRVAELLERQGFGDATRGFGGGATTNGSGKPH